MSKMKKIYILSITIIAIIIVFSIKKISTHKHENYQFTCGVPPSQINNFVRNSQQGIKLVFQPTLRWGKNILKVFFIDIYDSNTIEKTLNIANEWSKYANIKFILTTSIFDSDIRVSFRERRGYLSLIGNSANDQMYQGKATIWLQNLDTRPENEFRRVVLHEFGHSIGLEHELQSPIANVLWDSVAVYKYYDSIYHWEKEMVDDNVFRKINTKEFTKFDPNSIMIYAVPDFLTKNHVAISWPNKLSLLDKMTIKKYYPF